MALRRLNRALTASSIIGVILSVYALYVEMALEIKDKNYKPFCDISEHVSCSHVLGSKYAKGFGIAKGTVADIPNCVHGILFYCLIIFLATFDQPFLAKLTVWCCWLSVASSIYLAYILYFVLHDLCVVCVSTYLVNIINLLLAKAKLTRVNVYVSINKDD